MCCNVKCNYNHIYINLYMYLCKKNNYGTYKNKSLSVESLWGVHGYSQVIIWEKGNVPSEPNRAPRPQGIWHSATQGAIWRQGATKKGGLKTSFTYLSFVTFYLYNMPPSVLITSLHVLSELPWYTSESSPLWCVLWSSLLKALESSSDISSLQSSSCMCES